MLGGGKEISGVDVLDFRKEYSKNSQHKGTYESAFTGEVTYGERIQGVEWETVLYGRREERKGGTTGVQSNHPGIGKVIVSTAVVNKEG